METYILAGTPGAGQIALIVLAVLILFGGQKIPEFARSLGKALKEFKKATKDIEDSVNSDKE